jgi:hypothetical protein
MVWWAAFLIVLWLGVPTAIFVLVMAFRVLAIFAEIVREASDAAKGFVVFVLIALGWSIAMGIVSGFGAAAGWFGILLVGGVICHFSDKVDHWRARRRLERQSGQPSGKTWPQTTSGADCRATHLGRLHEGMEFD